MWHARRRRCYEVGWVVRAMLLLLWAAAMGVARPTRVVRCACDRQVEQPEVGTADSGSEAGALVEESNVPRPSSLVPPRRPAPCPAPTLRRRPSRACRLERAAPEAAVLDRRLLHSFRICTTARLPTGVAYSIFSTAARGLADRPAD